MTEDERLMLLKTVHAVDYILVALSDGAGIADFGEIARAWNEGTRDLRERLNAAYEEQKR